MLMNGICRGGGGLAPPLGIISGSIAPTGPPVCTVTAPSRGLLLFMGNFSYLSAMKPIDALIDEYLDSARLSSVSYSEISTPCANELIDRKAESAGQIVRRLEEGGMFCIALLEAMFPGVKPYTPESVSPGIVEYRVGEAVNCWTAWAYSNGIVK